jgi:hypothetical protein
MQKAATMWAPMLFEMPSWLLSTMFGAGFEGLQLRQGDPGEDVLLPKETKLWILMRISS